MQHGAVEVMATAPPGFHSSSSEQLAMGNIKISTMQDFQLPNTFSLPEEVVDFQLLGTVGADEPQLSNAWQSDASSASREAWNAEPSLPQAVHMGGLYGSPNPSAIGADPLGMKAKGPSSAPPGLETKQTNVRAPQQQPQVQRKLDSQPPYYQQQPQLGVPSVRYAPYPSVGSFEGMGAPQTQFQPQVVPLQHHYAVPTGAQNSSSSAAGSAGIPAGGGSSAPQFQTGAPGMTSSYGFPGNPYYTNQFYYTGGQSPYYYSQQPQGGRGIYGGQGQYSAGGAPGMQAGYSDMYGQPAMGLGNQFPESMPYGAMPMHHSMGGPSSAGVPSQQQPQPGSSGKGGKQGVQAGGVSSGGQSGAIPDPHLYGAYNAYRREWMMQQQQHQQWGAPMMPPYAAPGVQSQQQQGNAHAGRTNDGGGRSTGSSNYAPRHSYGPQAGGNPNWSS